MLGPSKMRYKTLEETESFGRYVMEPLDQGFGHTLGNSLRRVMLSSLKGAAVTQVKIAGVSHQFSTITGVSEDVVEIVLNIKKIRIQADSDGPHTLRLQAKGPGEVTAGQITVPGGVRIVNPDLVIATLADNKINLDVELTVATGVGYELADEHKTNEIGVIPIDALFSPITKVNLIVDPTRVGRLSNFDKLTLEVTSDGSLAPAEAIKQAAQVLADHFAAVVNPVEASEDDEADAGYALPKVNDSIMVMSVEELDLPSRVSSRLVEHGIKTVGDVLNTPKDELLSMKSFGKKSYDTVIDKLKEMGVEA